MKVAPRFGWKRILLGTALMMTGLLALSSCDTSGELIQRERKWSQLLVLSAVPVDKQGSGEEVAYEPSCYATDSDPYGVVFNVLMQGTLDKKDADTEKDQSIIPMDRVNTQVIKEELVVENLFEFNLTCMEALPDAGSGCSGVVPGSLAAEFIDFFRYGEDSSAGRGKAAVALVVDMSGSMKGLVYPYAPYYEDSLAQVSQSLPPNFSTKVNATDPNWARLDGVKAFMENLNSDDDVILFTYNQEQIDVVCNLDPAYSYEEKKGNCLSSNRSLILDGTVTNPTAPIDAIRGTEEGRSPLWTAVYEAYELMSNDAKAQTSSFQHIVVIDDGPDTCAPSPDLNVCSGICAQYATTFEELKVLVEAEPDYSKRVPIHFVQMAAKGYTERDPRQQEMACLTGGQFLFIDTSVIETTNLKVVMETTLRRLAYVVRGYWRMAFSLQYLKRADTKTQPGYIYSLEGAGKVLPGDDRYLVTSEDEFSFRMGDQEMGTGSTTVEGLAQTDRRLSLRKACRPDEDDAKCDPGDDSADGACYTMSYWCDAQTLTCRSASNWLEDGSEGSCGNVPVRIQVTDNEGQGTTVSLGEVPTRCCHGACLPPMWPEPPYELTNPEGVGYSVFFFDSDEWAPLDPTDPSVGWVVYATYRQNAVVGLNQIQDVLNYDDVETWNWDEHWQCDAKTNCFPPASAE